MLYYFIERLFYSHSTDPLETSFQIASASPQVRGLKSAAPFVSVGWVVRIWYESCSISYQAAKAALWQARKQMRLRQRRREEAAPGLALLHRAAARERDAVMRSRLRWLGEQVGWFLGIVGCLLLMLILLPLIPILELYDDVRRAYEDE